MLLRACLCQSTQIESTIQYSLCSDFETGFLLKSDRLVVAISLHNGASVATPTAIKNRPRPKPIPACSVVLIIPINSIVAWTQHIDIASMPVVRVARIRWVGCLNARSPAPELSVLRPRLQKSVLRFPHATSGRRCARRVAVLLFERAIHPLVRTRKTPRRSQRSTAGSSTKLHYGTTK